MVGVKVILLWLLQLLITKPIMMSSFIFQFAWNWLCQVLYWQSPNRRAIKTAEIKFGETLLIPEPDKHSLGDCSPKMGGVSPLEDDPFRSTAAHSIGLPQSRPSRRDTVLVKLRPPLDCVKPMRTSVPLYLTRYKSVTVRLTHLVSFYLIYLHVDRFFCPPLFDGTFFFFC